MQKRSRCSSLKTVSVFSLALFTFSSCFKDKPAEEGSDDESRENSGSISGHALKSGTESDDDRFSDPGGDMGSKSFDLSSNNTADLSSEGSGSASGSGSLSSSDQSSDSNTTSSETDSTSDTTTTTTTTSMGTTSTEQCPKEAIQFKTVTPTVFLLVDKSGSMDESLDGSTSRWEAMMDVLSTGTNAVIPRMQSDVRFGLSTFGSVGSCPEMEHVAPGLNNLMSIHKQLEDTDVNGGTPTGNALLAMQSQMEGDNFDGPKYLVLVTDGEPYKCGALSTSDGTDEAGTEAAVTTLHEAGFETFVISVGDDTKDSHLQAVANLGKGMPTPVLDGDPKAKFYKSTDRDALVGAFEEIINGTRSCKLALDGRILDGYEKEGRVVINGVEKVYNDPNGWRVNNPKEIELLGSACTAIRQGDVEVQVEFDCNAIVPG